MSARKELMAEYTRAMHAQQQALKALVALNPGEVGYEAARDLWIATEARVRVLADQLIETVGDPSNWPDSAQ